MQNSSVPPTARAIHRSEEEAPAPGVSRIGTLRGGRRPTRVPGPAILLIGSALVLACAETPVAPLVESPSIDAQFDVGAGVIERVVVGSNDLCPALGLRPGCDANFSLVANRFADGTVTGQWQDGFGKDANGDPLGGIHASVDCLEVVNLNIGIYSFTVAWVSGVVTQSSNPSFGVGDGVITAAVDRGTSENDLFEDLASFTFPLSYFSPGTTCHDQPNLPVFLNVAFNGQVDIWSRR